MNLTLQKSKAEFFRKLHFANDPLILPNAWDAISAKLFEKSGAKAIGTTSAGVAAALGFPDGQKTPNNIFLSAVKLIIESVDIPVTVDLEAGYGKTISEICDIVRQVIELGAVGINIEDTDFSKEPNKLEKIIYQVDKISSIREIAKKTEVPIFINARSDVYWLKDDTVTDQYAEINYRFSKYLEAGADGVFIHGITDLTVLHKICQSIKAPVNALAGTWMPPMNKLKEIGVARISIGSGMFRASAGFIQQTTKKYLHDHDFRFLAEAIPYHDICEWAKAGRDEVA